MTKYIASCSFGKDSLAMLIKIKELKNIVDKAYKKGENCNENQEETEDEGK